MNYVRTFSLISVGRHFISLRVMVADGGIKARASARGEDFNQCTMVTSE